ncbi:reverse transcriptase domain-containing protein [Tanacetum coccineum]
MAERTMEELLRAPTEGYGEAIVLPEINADHFEIKTNLLQLVQANPFYGRESENPHAHINSFKRITSTLRFRNVPNDVIKLMMFPYSLEGAAKTWYEKEPPNSILTWEDLVTKFVNQFFPPSKTTHLKNEISRFTQKFEETFSEAWERFKELLRACPHHGFTKLTQVDTFYNGLNENEQDSLNAAAGGNILSKTTREALNIIENKSKVRYSRNRSNASRMNATSSKTDERIDKLADQLLTLVEIVSKKVVTLAPVKAVEESCVTCGGAHSWYNCPATDNNQASVCATTGTYNQVNPLNRVSNQMAPPGFAPVQNNGQNRFNQNQVQGNNFNRGNNFHGNQGFQAQNNHAPNFQNQGFQNQPFQVPNNQVQQEISNDFSSYKRNNDQMLRNMQNQINSLKGDLKNEIQNTIKSQQAVMMNQQTTFQNNLQNMICGLFQNQASTSGTLPSNTIPNPKGEMKAITTRSGVAYEGPSIPTNPSPKKNLPKPNIPYPSRRDDQKSRDKASNQMEKIFQIFQDLRFDISFADALLLMPRFAPTIKSLLMNKEKLLELAKIPLNENCSAMLLKKLPEKLGDPGKFLIPCDFPGMDICHALADLGASINLIPLLFWKKLSLPELTPTRMTLELADRSITHPKGLAEDVYVKVGKFHFPTDFVVISGSSIEEPPELELKDLSSHLEYAFLEENDKLPVIIAKGLKNDENDALLKVLKSHKRAIAWKITDIKEALPKTPILVFCPLEPIPFELLCGCQLIRHGAFLEQRKMKHFHQYIMAKQTMTEAQIHYTTTEKETIAVVYAFEKFRPYLGLSKSIAYTDHSALKYLMNKQDAKSRLLRWVLLLQEFDITIRDKKESENLAADHLSRLENPHKDVLENKDINEHFPLETLGVISSESTPWFADYANYHAGNFIIKGMTTQHKKKFFRR